MPRRFVIAASLALAAVLACPLAVHASKLETDAVCGTAVSKSGIAAADLPDITARSAMVVGKDGTVYFERNVDEEVKIASITKVMTAIVALENAKLTDTVTVDEAAATVGEASAGLEEGDAMPLSTALRALMIPSGNDAAMAIAASVGKIIDPDTGDPRATFVEAMNDKAKELGMDRSVFTNPHGLDFDGWEGDLHSSARDVIAMYSHAMGIKEFRELEADGNAHISVKGKDGQTREIDMIDYNKMRGQDGNIAGKTGTTYDAGQCYVAAFSREDGGEVYTVVLGSDGDDARWADTRALTSWYYGHMVDYPLVRTSRKTAGGDPLVARVALADWSDKTVDATVEDPGKTARVFSLEGDITVDVDAEPVAGSVARGQEVGELKLMQDGHEVASEMLVAAQDQAAPSGLDWVLVHLDRLVRLVLDEPMHAGTQVLAE